MLILTRCKNIKIIPIGRMKKLVELNAYSCHLLKEVPLENGRLSNLRNLSLSPSSIHTLSPTIIQLSLLQELHLKGCDKLQELPEPPLGLTNLTVTSNCLKKIHDLSKLDIVSSSLIANATNIEATQKLAKLKKLELHLSKATTTPLDLSYLTQLE